MSIGPESTPLTRMLEEEEQKWSRALISPRKVSTLIELERIYYSGTKKVGISEVSRRHPVFQGLTRMVDTNSPNNDSLGYNCNSCKAIYAGKPNITPSNISGYINFDCGVCNTTLDSREVRPNKRTC